MGEQGGDKPGNRVVVLEGIYSMLGDSAPLKEFVAAWMTIPVALQTRLGGNYASLVRSATIGFPARSRLSNRAISSSGQARKRSSMTTASAVSSAVELDSDFELFGSIVPSSATENSTVHLKP